MFEETIIENFNGAIGLANTAIVDINDQKRKDVIKDLETNGVNVMIPADFFGWSINTPTRQNNVKPKILDNETFKLKIEEIRVILNSYLLELGFTIKLKYKGYFQKYHYQYERKYEFTLQGTLKCYFMCIRFVLVDEMSSLELEEISKLQQE